MEGRDKADPPFWQTGQRKGKGKSTKEVKSGSRQDECSIQRSSQHGLPRVGRPLFPAAAIVSSSQPGSQSTQARGSSGMGYPAALAAPFQEPEESENRSVSGKARVFIQSNGADN